MSGSYRLCRALQRMVDMIIQPRLLRPREAAGYCGVSVPQWGKMVEAGAAPRGIQLTKRIKVWDIQALDTWIDSLCQPKINSFAGVK